MGMTSRMSRRVSCLLWSITKRQKVFLFPCCAQLVVSPASCGSQLRGLILFFLSVFFFIYIYLFPGRDSSKPGKKSEPLKPGIWSGILKPINSNPSYKKARLLKRAMADHRVPTLPPPPSSKPVTAGRNHLNSPSPYWDRRVIWPNHVKSSSALAPMWTPYINESAELTQGAL
jgi:hypothetical protein